MHHPSRFYLTFEFANGTLYILFVEKAFIPFQNAVNTLEYRERIYHQIEEQIFCFRT